MNKSYTISQYSKSIERLLKSKVPPIWVQGVISQLQRRGSVVYLTLTEFSSQSEKPVATLNLMCWANEFDQLQHKTSQAELAFEIQTELKVSFLVEAGFYVPMGKFQPKITDIDLKFTQGEMALTREKILKKLIVSGLINKNKALRINRPCLRIGLITAPDSAAYHDFNNALNTSPYQFQIQFEPAVMQGERTSESIVSAMNHLSQYELDVIVITRGGGAKTDLIYFDSEIICHQIANYHIPVISGIGHQIDQSLTDQVAWLSRMTPTDCAKSLIEMADEDLEYLLVLQQRIKDVTLVRLSSQHALMQQFYTQLSTSTHQYLDSSKRFIQEAISILRKRPVENIKLQFDRFHRNETGLDRGASKLLLQNDLRLRALKDRLQRVAQSKLQFQKESLKLKSKWVSSISPQRTLERGYTLTRTQSEDSRSVDELEPGNILITETKEWLIESTLKQKTKKMNKE